MKGWNDLGIVDTIYEEDYENTSSSPSLSPSLSSSPTPLHSRVESWSQSTGKEPDVAIYVEGTRFHLHKDPLTSRSAYLKRQLKELSEITLPLNIRVETFILIADFCYGTHVVITPSNIAALRTAAELLEMTETSVRLGENLSQITEAYFRCVIAVNSELALIVFRSCMHLLPEAETAPLLVSRCLDALNLSEDGEELDGCLNDIMTLRCDEFQIVVESMQDRFTSHDLLYRIIDLYIKEQNGKISEEQKTELCKSIDCDKLSGQLLMHAVQNPDLPLRFIFRATLIDQLNTRRAFIANMNTNRHHNNHRQQRQSQPADSVTLGSILHRDAAAREAAQLKAEMHATNSRIQSLEKELAGMKKFLHQAELKRCVIEKRFLEENQSDRIVLDEHDNALLQIKHEHGHGHEDERELGSVMDSSRSASFHYGSRDGKIDKGEKGSTSFAGFRFGFKSDQSSKKGSSAASSMSKPSGSTGKSLIKRLTSSFFTSKLSASTCIPENKKHSPTKTQDRNGEAIQGDDREYVSLPNEDLASRHKRSYSLG